MLRQLCDGRGFVMIREDTIQGRHLIDLSRQAYEKGIPFYSNFLNLNEQNIFHGCKAELYGEYQLFGGYEGAERQMIAFLPDAFLRAREDHSCRHGARLAQFPITCCRISPRNRRFSEDLTHRDVLGSLMNLGLERELLGDILIHEQAAYLFCHSRSFPLIQRDLDRIRHTSVTVEAAEHLEGQIGPRLELCQGTVRSNRLDSILAEMCHLSRSQAAELLRRGLVFRDGRQAVGASDRLKPGEIISIRGTGRFQFLEEQGETKKGRVKVSYYKYV